MGHFGQSNGIVPPHGHIIAELFNVMHEIEREAVVVVEDEEFQLGQLSNMRICEYADRDVRKNQVQRLLVAIRWSLFAIFPS